MLTRMEDLAEAGKKPTLIVQVPSDTGEYLMNNKRDNIARIEENYDVQITLQIRPDLVIPHYRIERQWNEDNQQRVEVLEDTSKGKKPARSGRKLKPSKPVVGIPPAPGKHERRARPGKSWWSTLIEKILGDSKTKKEEEERKKGARGNKRGGNRGGQGNRNRSNRDKQPRNKKDGETSKQESKQGEEKKKSRPRRRNRNRPKREGEQAQSTEENKLDAVANSAENGSPEQSGETPKPRRRRRRRRPSGNSGDAATAENSQQTQNAQGAGEAREQKADKPSKPKRDDAPKREPESSKPAESVSEAS